MPRPDAPPLTRMVVLRGLGFGVAIALGAVAVWLIVIGDSTKSMRIGVLAGIWGALLGAYSMFGSRRQGLEFDEQSRSVSDVPVMSAQEIAIRSTSEVERIAEAAARRAFEDRLEQMLRREVSREVGDLRGEIARLRQDLLDKVGGQLRLERIETTRVIGSDLEALQHEVRQLISARESGTLHELGIGAATLRAVVEPKGHVEPATVRPVNRPAEAAPAVARAAQPAPAETTGPIRRQLPEGSPRPPSPSSPSDDPFASLPRITPFTEFDLDPVDTTPHHAANGAVPHAVNGATSHAANGTTSHAANGATSPTPSGAVSPTANGHNVNGAKPHHAANGTGSSAKRHEPNPVEARLPSPVAPSHPAYTGRRRRTDGQDPDTGRHAHQEPPTPPMPPQPAAGRRRRTDDDGNDSDLLSRLLARGSADR